MNNKQYKMITVYLNKKTSVERALEGFSESELRESVGITTAKSGKTFGWRHILVYMLSTGNTISSDFLAEVMSNTFEEIATLNKTELHDFCKRFHNLWKRVVIKIVP